ncbi:DUF6030 family protein [Azotobacter beijerinckii]|uniref:DUF6030 family protein n=1 Tax=Azotobacter beijerinckii TaxID=170623 RepID=UPI0011135B2A|nr:DUF6030 family protein [Azotobacter beijerinckii]
MNRNTALIFILFFSSPALAELKSTTPAQVCNLMIEAGLSTGGWKNHYDQEFGCSSPYKDIGSALPLPNNLAFYAEGNRDSVKSVKLVLNVNDRSTASSANKQLQKAAAILFQKITSEKIPQPIMNAIINGKGISQKAGISQVEVIRDNWPTGKGYEIKIVIK